MSDKNISYQEMATTILELVGGKGNIQTYTNCVTRLRVSAIDDDLVDVEKLKDLSYVITVQKVAGVFQIVLGPGTVLSVRKEFDTLVGGGTEQIDENLDEMPKKSLMQKFSEMMQAIIMPAISVLLAAALILGLLNIFKLLGFDSSENIYLNALQLFGGVTMKGLGVFFAINTAIYFKGNMYIAAALAMLITSESSITNIILFGEPLSQGVGGLIGIVLMAVTMCYIERNVDKFVPKSLKLLVVPLVTVLLTMVVLLFVIIPASDFLTTQLVNLFTFLSEGSEVTRVIGSVVIAGIFPFLVLTGLHQSVLAVLLTIYIETGHTPFVAAAWLGGAAQVGTAAAIYVLYRKKEPKLNEIFLAGAPAAFVGVIEPLMYGINIPRFKPFLIAMASAAVGGFFIGITGITQQYGLSGIVGMLSFDTFRESIIYGLVWIGTLALGFIVCYTFYKKNKE